MSIYTEDHLALQNSLRKLIETEINPCVDKWEDEGMFPAHELFPKLGEAGFLGITMPEAFGGMGLDFSYLLAFAETVGEINAVGLHMAIGIQAVMSTAALAKYGSDELREQFLRPTISGEQVVCLGVSEPGAGSDVSQIKTNARKDGDDYVINGGKIWITNGVQADWMCLLANTNEGSPHTSKSLICLPMKTPGVTVAKKLDKMGMRSSDTAQIFFDDVRIPQRYRIGEEGKGFVYQMEQFQGERLFAAAAHVRPMEKAILDTIDYTNTRKVFGRRVIDNQVVRFKLGELQTKIELLRSLIYRATQEYCAGQDVTTLASMAKLTAGRLMREVADSCLQYYGGMGFMNETPISRFYRDCRVTSIGGGTDEIMLEIITKRMGIGGQ
ncbi:acyl-CoA dehydrogenase family protein [Magnetospirillum sp. 15-1]|uniref:acyl-CoA dehydrogenase family protein n=1 Tax=Magnetospirillum sp. 15-1 TaxID=1979370 RepID=UPI000BBCDF9B|nr:acyl-CoA dehydrogenase family protein [Magnetospirillum sp. 15-1]